MPTAPPKKYKPRHLAKYSNNPVFGRSRLLAQLQKKTSELSATSKLPEVVAFAPQHFWVWVSNYLKSVFHHRYKPFPVYPAGMTGIYPLQAADGGTVIRIAMAGDWGTGTLEAEQVADSMMKWHPDYTIHLGDVYFVGDTPEIEENCLGKSRNGYQGVKWPHGSLGSFAMNGNHEMYGGGEAYFKVFLPTLGLRNLGLGKHPQKQCTSFCCMETPCWRILVLDTGYNSVGLPILGGIPWINTLSFVGADCRLEDGLTTWLRDVVQPQKHIKPTLLLSHHQYYTAFADQVYTLPAKQLAEFFPNQELLWIWGHEHRMAIYDQFALKEGGNLRAYGRCLGHGGMPVQVSHPSSFNKTKAPITFYDGSTHKLNDGALVGRNGFVVLTLDGYTLKLDYRDLNNQPMFAEKFVGQADGKLQYSHTPPPAGGLTAA